VWQLSTQEEAVPETPSHLRHTGGRRGTGGTCTQSQTRQGKQRHVIQYGMGATGAGGYAAAKVRVFMHPPALRTVPAMHNYCRWSPEHACDSAPLPSDPLPT
jgi:hypothetical protein